MVSWSTQLSVIEIDHSDCDCVLIAVLTHGDGENRLYARDCAYQTERLWSQFTSTACPTLAGKPKLFFSPGNFGKLKLLRAPSQTNNLRLGLSRDQRRHRYDVGAERNLYRQQWSLLQNSIACRFSSREIFV